MLLIRPIQAALLKASVIAILTSAIGTTFAEGEAKRPANVIVIVTDDMGYQDLGVTGLQDFETPQMDGLAKDGIRFTDGYVSASVCCPSRAGLLTARYQQRFGHEFNNFAVLEPGFTKADLGLDPGEKTIGDAMRAVGYRTLCVGKWHMGSGEAYHPLHRGFDECYSIDSGNRSYFPYKNDAGRSVRIQRNRDLVPEEEIDYVTDSLTDATVNWIGENRDTPFFIYLAYTAPHTPMHGKKEDIEQMKRIRDKNRRIYAAMMKSLDEGIGRIRGKLDELGLTRDTLILFVNDNGGATNNGSDNGRYRGMKGSKWEGGIRVPFFATWPGTLPAGKTFSHPVISLDILPTAVAASGKSYESAKPLDGVNLLPYLLREKEGEPHDVLFWRRGVAAAARMGSWKLLRVEGNEDLLFDLSKDPGERRNLARSEPGKLAKLKSLLSEWEKDLGPPKWTEGAKWEKNQVMKHRPEVDTRAKERKYP